MKVVINKYGFKVKPVYKPIDIQKGMMNNNFNSSFSGMLFLMDDKEHCFWMKNCIIPLDIIFIKNKVITKLAPGSTIVANNYFWLHGRRPFKENKKLSRELLRIRGSFFDNL